MTTNNKIIKIDDVGSKDFTDVVLCYGHFNLTHPGHLRYLQQAKSLVKNLVVAIISDNSLDQDSFGQHFSELERAESIANLEIVNHVVILNSTGLIGLIKILKPNFLILGKEFEKQKDEEILLAIKTANKSGKVIFHAGETSYATTYLLHDNVTNIESNNISKLKSICKNNKNMSSGLLNLIDDFANINLKYKNNFSAFLKLNWSSPIKIRLIKIYFEKGLLIYDENEGIYKVSVYKKSNQGYNLEMPTISKKETLKLFVNSIIRHCTKM